jgi:hypothetical protein
MVWHGVSRNVIPIYYMELKGVKFTLEQAMKAKRGRRGVALLFL